MEESKSARLPVSVKDLVERLRKKSDDRRKILGAPNVPCDEIEAMFHNQYRMGGPIAAVSGTVSGVSSANGLGEAEVDWYRKQGETSTDNLGSVMPVTIYRITWQTNSGENQEFLTRSYEDALQKKHEIDHSNGQLVYLNFESWFAYRSPEHDLRFGRVQRDRAWWE